MINAPIALFVYSRLDHTQRTVRALQRNQLAKESHLVVFSDGPKTHDVAERVYAVRDYVRMITGFASVTVIERATNFGLAKSVIDGVTSTINIHGRTIVLEDDMVTSPYFLTYMNQALEKYALDDRVISIHGYVYPVRQPLPESFFLRGADCWGWATWRRGWALFNSDGQELLNQLKRRQLLTAFDFNGTYPFSGMLLAQIAGTNDSWAIRWHASAFLANKLTLYPGRSLVHNIGNDKSGTHCGESDRHDVVLSESLIDLSLSVVVESVRARKAFEDFFRKSNSRLQRVRWLLDNFLRRMVK